MRKLKLLASLSRGGIITKDSIGNESYEDGIGTGVSSDAYILCALWLDVSRWPAMHPVT